MTEILQRIGAFFDILSTRNVLFEIAAVALCLLAGGFLGAALRSRHERRRIKTPTALTWSYFTSQGSVVATLQAGTVPIALEIARAAAGRWLEGAEFLFERGRIAMTLPSPMAVERVAEVVIDDAERARPQLLQTPEIAIGLHFYRCWIEA